MIREMNRIGMMIDLAHVSARRRGSAALQPEAFYTENPYRAAAFFFLTPLGRVVALHHSSSASHQTR